MTAHAVVRQTVPAGIEVTFDLVHDYSRRLSWDTLLRSARTVDDVPPGRGVEAVCAARWRVGGLSFRTRYVTFRRPDLAAVVLVGSPPQDREDVRRAARPRPPHGRFTGGRPRLSAMWPASSARCGSAAGRPNR